MGRPVSGDMPIGFAGSATAGRLSGAGTTPGFPRVGLGEGVASTDSEGVGEAVGEGEPVIVGDGEPEAAGDDAGLGVGAAEVTGAGITLGTLAADEGGEPDGVAVHPASTPAQTRALRAITGRVTRSGYASNRLRPAHPAPSPTPGVTPGRRCVARGRTRTRLDRLG